MKLSRENNTLEMEIRDLKSIAGNMNEEIARLRQIASNLENK